MFIKLILLMLICLICTIVNVSHASDRWVAVNKGQTYIDNNLTIDDKGIVSFWLKMYPPKKQKFSYEIMYLSVNCISREVAVESDTTYSKNGTVLNNFTENYRDWNKIVPESIMEPVYDRVCPKSDQRFRFVPSSGDEIPVESK